MSKRGKQNNKVKIAEHVENFELHGDIFKVDFRDDEQPKKGAFQHLKEM